MEQSKNSQILVVVGTLIEAAADKDEGVREAVGASLRKLAKKCPNDVLENAAAFRKRNPKMSGPHLVVLLRLMEQICQEHLEDVSDDVVRKLVEFSVEEMTRSTEYLPDVQIPASGILVALGQKHCIEVSPEGQEDDLSGSDDEDLQLVQERVGDVNYQEFVSVDDNVITSLDILKNEIGIETTACAHM